MIPLTRIIFTLLFTAGTLCTHAAVRPIVPKPVSLIEKDGPGYTLTPATAISCDPAFTETASYAAKALAPALGYTLKVQPGVQKTGIIFKKAAKEMPAEGYALEITPTGATITASTRAGAFYGFQTLRQLLPVEIFGQTKAEADWSLPALTIEDAPRFPWRGLHFDPCRHFFDKAATLALLDTMAAHKMNTLHFHLTDDQGWRIEIKKYPLLTEIGGKRLNSVTLFRRNTPDGKPYGPYFFTQDDIREIVAYAAARSITVVPEIELPGHAMAALAAYPHLSCFGKFQNGKPFTPRWLGGIDDDVFCAGNDQTIQFLEDVFDEVLELFPSKIIHAGGDECPKVRWKKCPKCQQRIKDHNLKNEHQLQAWMINHFDAYLASKGRRLMGWTEILEGGTLSTNAAVMSWLGLSGALEAVKGNRQVVMVPSSALYLDYAQLPPAMKDPHEYIGGMNSIEKVYAYNPTAGIPPEKHHLILGAQGNNWSEYTRTPAELQWKMWPRAAAIAEMTWTPQPLRNPETFFAGMRSTHMNRLKAMGINAAPLPATPFASWSPATITTEWQTKNWDATAAITEPGTWLITFAFAGGDCRLDIKETTLLINGTPAATDAHPGTTGWANKGNTYTLTLPELPPGAKLTLQATIRADGGTDSNGGVFIRKK